jgi:hypothetical protein
LHAAVYIATFFIFGYNFFIDIGHAFVSLI